MTVQTDTRLTLTLTSTFPSLRRDQKPKNTRRRERKNSNWWTLQWQDMTMNIRNQKQHPSRHQVLYIPRMFDPDRGFFLKRQWQWRFRELKTFSLQRLRFMFKATHILLQFGETSITESTLHHRPEARGLNMCYDVLAKNTFLTARVDTVYWFITAVVLMFLNKNVYRGHYTPTCGHECYLRVFNSASNEWDIELNTRR